LHTTRTQRPVAEPRAASAAPQVGSIFGIYEPKEECSIEDAEDPTKLMVRAPARPPARPPAVSWASGLGALPGPAWPGLARPAAGWCMLLPAAAVEAHASRRHGTRTGAAASRPPSPTTATSQENCVLNVCQPGSRLLAAGYCLYSCASIMVITIGNGERAAGGAALRTPPARA
jgi:hypothetical protein